MVFIVLILSLKASIRDTGYYWVEGLATLIG